MNMFGMPSWNIGGKEKRKKGKESVEDMMQIIKEIDANRKIVELDLEKRTVVLENEMEKIKKLLGDIKDLGEVKELVENSEEIKEKIRNLEDMKYVENLEVMDIEERIGAVEEVVETNKKKLAILEEAIDTLTKKGLPSGDKELENKVRDMKHQVEAMLETFHHLREEMVTKKDVESIKELANKGREMINEINREMTNLTSTIKEKFEAYDLKLNEYEEKIKEKVMRLDSLNKSIERAQLDAENAKKLAEKTYEVMEKTRRGMLLKYETLEEKYNNIDHNIDKEIKRRMNEVLRRYNKAMQLLEFQVSGLKRGLDELKGSEKAIEEERIEKIERELRKIKKNIDEKYKEIKTIGESISEILSKRANIKAEEVKRLLNLKKVKKIEHYISKLEELEEGLVRRVEEQEVEIKGLKKGMELLREKLKDIHKRNMSDVENKIKELREEMETFKNNQMMRGEKYLRELVDGKMEEIIENVVLRLSKDSKLKEYEKKELAKIKEEVDAYLLTLSKNLYKHIEEKLHSLQEQMENLQDEENGEGIGGYTIDELVEIIKDSVWSEVASIISSHEITENAKIKLSEEFTKQIREEVDNLKAEMISFIREQKDSALDVEDLKRKVFDLIKEEKKNREREMKELKEYVNKLLKEQLSSQTKSKGERKSEQSKPSSQHHKLKESDSAKGDAIQKDDEIIDKIKQLEEEIKEIKKERGSHLQDISYNNIPYVIE